MDLVKVVIADDEKIIREGMEQFIPWEKEGMKLVGSARNGREALELFSREKADFLITDIRMPVMDGLELLEHLEKEFPNASVIFISAHGDFEYTKKAIKSRMVYDYLLKPFELEDLMQLLRDVISHRKLETLPLEDFTSENAPKGEVHDYSKYSPLIQNCLQLIDKLYSQHDLSLTVLANELGVSANYLSTYFKNETGKGFAKYLQEKRIEEGKKLMPDIRLKTYEIANKVGIQDSRYFSRLFKELMGMTPSEYKDNYYRKRKE